MKPGSTALKAIRLSDQARERIRYPHYSLNTEQVYVYWVKFFVRWHRRSGVTRHPREMGAVDVEAFLTMLATDRKVSPFTQNQALSALLFLYREVLAIDLPWLIRPIVLANQQKKAGPKPRFFANVDGAANRFCFSITPHPNPLPLGERAPANYCGASAAGAAPSFAAAA